ncbi:hypothetical protein PQX77_016088 [Marasmius sp. AFHP31]|nr:hypothetical protein PQX77_016088 [Marasmius sp. AFHP31]
MLSTIRQIVFLVGATGKTGGSIARALAKQTEKFELRTIVRSSSVDKPFIKELASLGVKIITGDIVNDPQDTLEAHLKDVDTVIIASVPLPEGHQDNLIRAAKAAGVKRVVPSDFATYAPPGSMQGQDMASSNERRNVSFILTIAFLNRKSEHKSSSSTTTSPTLSS